MLILIFEGFYQRMNARYSLIINRINKKKFEIIYLIFLFGLFLLVSFIRILLFRIGRLTMIHQYLMSLEKT